MLGNLSECRIGVRSRFVLPETGIPVDWDARVACMELHAKVSSLQRGRDSRGSESGPGRKETDKKGKVKTQRIRFGIIANCNLYLFFLCANYK